MWSLAPLLVRKTSKSKKKKSSLHRLGDSGAGIFSHETGALIGMITGNYKARYHIDPLFLTSKVICIIIP
jgi:hypothetical protein